MSFYKLFRPVFFYLKAENAHNLAINFLKFLPNFVTLFCFNKKHQNLQNKVWNIDFLNPIGLAAGFDKNAQTVLTLAKFGFGFIEVGTITPKPQEGNLKPRMFRLQKDKAIINRLGFNNLGAELAAQNIEQLLHHINFAKSESNLILGINIGKNKDTKNFADDYIKMLDKFYRQATYITINISSPNTKNLRDIQKEENLEEFLQKIVAQKQNIQNKCKKNVPILLKIAPDLTEEEQEKIAKIILKQKIDGLIISNTTIDRNLNLKSSKKNEVGGLSGQPLFEKSNQVLANFYKLTKGKVPIIGVGGISNAKQAYEKIKLGASLVQIYSAFIYEGFGLVERIKKDLSKMLKEDGFENISQAIGHAQKELK